MIDSLTCVGARNTGGRAEEHNSFVCGSNAPHQSLCARAMGAEGKCHHHCSALPARGACAFLPDSRPVRPFCPKTELRSRFDRPDGVGPGTASAAPGAPGSAPKARCERRLCTAPLLLLRCAALALAHGTACNARDACARAHARSHERRLAPRVPLLRVAPAKEAAPTQNPCSHFFHVLLSSLRRFRPHQREKPLTEEAVRKLAAKERGFGAGAKKPGGGGDGSVPPPKA